jgi:hypothetical protein
VTIAAEFGGAKSRQDDSVADDGPASRDWIPSCWSGDARAIPGAYRFGESTRPWNWLELRRDDAERLWSLLFGFVTFFNARYGERVEKRIPPCWVEHGPLVEELTTLVFARWHAFESPHASVGGAQYWHSYTLPSFYDRVREWLGDELLACQQGRHRDHLAESPGIDVGWLARGLTVGDLDGAMRAADREEKQGTETDAPRGVEIPFLDSPATVPITPRTNSINGAIADVQGQARASSPQ